MSFGGNAIVAIGGGYRIARGWWYTKLSLSSALLPSFSGLYFVALFLSFVVFVFMPLLELVDAPLKKVS